MTPVEIGKGQSFKGLSAYLMGDVRQKGEAVSASADRVGWAQTYNLADAPPDQAWRLMAATAMSADALKEAAGLKKGKPVKNTVYHFSLNFNPKDDPHEDVQRIAVEEALAALGLEGHQALAVQHRDKAHTHIHVMVNLIDPENGMSAASPQMQANGKKAAKLSFAQKKLSKWAAKFERDNGLTVTEGRLANANKREQGEKVDARRKPRNVYERDQTEGTDRRRDVMKRSFKGEARELQDEQEAMKAQHRDEWDALKASYRSEKDAIKVAMSPAMKGRVQAIKDAHKPAWQAMFDRHIEERRVFAREDKSAIGRIWHAAAVIRDRALDGDVLGGFVASFNREERRAIILRKQDREREAYGRRVRDQIEREMQEMKADFDGQFSRARTRFLAACDDLKADHDRAWSEMRKAWKAYNEKRQQAFAHAQAGILDRKRQIEQTRGRGLRLDPN
jgi:hypothetical protein